MLDSADITSQRKFIKKYQTETENYVVNLHPVQWEIEQKELQYTIVIIFNDILDWLTKVMHYDHRMRIMIRHPALDRASIYLWFSYVS